MLLKNRMHPKNIYKNPPNFKELAIQYQEFRKYVKTDLSGKVTIDYQDPNAVKELTRTLLKKDFNLEVDIDETRLIPRVPLSLNYILWIEDLLSMLQLKTEPLGIDIGTGCVCIYSLLAAKKGWKMLATELDPDNFKCAEKNVTQNNLNGVISIKLVSNSDDLLVGVLNENLKYDFCMCNPPFFNYNEKPQNRTARRKQLGTVASEIPTEMSTEGGELAFISKLIKESEILHDKVKIYTTLIGKKSDFMHLKKEVQNVGPKSIAFTEFCQGRTTRWGLAWTFLDIDLKDKAKSETEKVKKNKSKPPLQYILPSTKAGNLDIRFSELKNVLNELKIDFEEEPFDVGHTLHFRAYANTWSHQRRKKRLQARTGDVEVPHLSKAPEEEQIEENEGCSSAKRQKLGEVPNNNKSVIVEGLMALKSMESSIVFESSWIMGDKEALHQIFQYFKNYWNRDAESNN